MIRNNLQAARGKQLILLIVLLSLVIPVWAQTQGEDREQSQDLTRREDQFRSLTATAEPDAKPEGSGYTKHQLGYYLDPNQVSFVRPGLKFTIQGATIGTDNKLQVNFTITDNVGLPLDRNGVVTPGAISTSFVASYIPKGQSQYVAYTTGCCRRRGYLPANRGRNVHVYFWPCPAEHVRPDNDPYGRALWLKEPHGI
jgi:hypothetical protein